jgi:methylase of polypeptide subunit release factors
MALASYERILASDLTPVREALRGAGFDESICARIERSAVLAGQVDMEAAMDATSDGAPASILARLFVLGRPLSRDEARRTLGEAALGLLIDLGVLSTRDDTVHADISVLPIEKNYVLRDFSPLLEQRAIRDDHVLGVGPSSLILSSMTVRPHVRQALDLGTGQGYQAILASAHSQHVLATDVNPRALSAAALTAGLNERRNIEFRLGSLFEPVAGETFDLIVSNPPFLIVPPTDLVAVASRFEGDRLVESLVRAAPAHLSEGGYLCLMGSWHHRTPEDWSERPLSWLEGSGCDVWLLNFEMITPAECTMKFRREFERSSLTRVERREWLDYYRHLGAELVTIGALVLRRRTGRNWVRTDRVMPDFHRPWAGGIIQTIIQNETLLRGQPLGSMLDQNAMLSPTVEVEQKWRAAADGGLAVVSATIRHAAALEFPLAAHASVLRLMTLLDGRRTIRECLVEVAHSMSMEPERLIADSVPGLKRLAELGYLILLR